MAQLLQQSHVTARQQTIIEQETRRTLRHVGLEEDSDSNAPFSNDRDPDHIVLFFIEIAPTSTSGGAKWKLPPCTRTTRPQTSCYHVDCFEKICRLILRSVPQVHARTDSVGLSIVWLSGKNLINEDHLLDGGVERLV